MKAMLATFSFLTVFSAAWGSEEILDAVTESVESVCAKPAQAGEHWDIKVKGDGGAGIGLKKLKLLGVSGEVDFTQGEWSGIKTSVEDAKDYRQCVTALTPLFLERFSIKSSDEDRSSSATSSALGGIKWSDSALGVELVLSGCTRTGLSVACQLTVESLRLDSEVRIKPAVFFDQSGTLYKASSISLANVSQRLYVKSQLVQEVVTPLSFNFSDVGRDSKQVSKFEVQISLKGKGSHSYIFRNIDIKI